jgi:hypothetical protein
MSIKILIFQISTMIKLKIKNEKLRNISEFFAFYEEMCENWLSEMA